MMLGRKNTCSQSDAGQKIVFFAILSCLFLSCQVSGRKELDSDDSAPLVAKRSTLYKSNSNDNDFQVLSDGSHPDDYISLQHRGGGPSLGSYRTKSKRPKFYILKKNPRSSSQRNKYYSVAGLQSSAQPGSRSFSRGYRTHPSSRSPNVLYYDSPTGKPHNEYSPTTEDGNKYAFAYAVRPKDGFTAVPDDFSLSHKESRDGKVTMGEYKVLLPDGRLQVVRYTADGKSGFKADVTYEDGGHEHEHGRVQSHPNVEVQRQYVVTPQSPSRSVTPSPYKTNSIYTPKSIKTYPSVSPVVYYHSGSDEHHHLDHQNVHPSSNSLGPAGPTPQVYYKISPSPQSLKKSRLGPAYISFNKAVGPTAASYFKSSNPTSKAIYEKVHKQNPHYAPVARGQRAGPATAHNEASIPKEHSPSYVSYLDKSRHAHPSYEISTNPVTQHHSAVQPNHHYAPDTGAHFSPENTHYQRPGITQAYPSPPPVTSKKHRILKQVVHNPEKVHNSKLVPFSVFKAGPKRTPTIPHQTHHIEPHYESHGHSHEKGSHYILEEVPHHDYHDDIEHHHSYYFQTPVKKTYPPVKSSLATFTSNLAYAGISTPKPPLFVKSKPVIPVGRPVKPSVGGLVYLESPGAGLRPSGHGVKEHLSGIPHDNLPRPKTTTHPYELGSSDYGTNVGYSPGSQGAYATIRKKFKASPRIPKEYLPGGTRN